MLSIDQEHRVWVRTHRKS